MQIHGLGGKLDTNLEDGVKDKPEEIQRRKDAYGSNTYPKKKPKGLLVRIVVLTASKFNMQTQTGCC